MFYEKQSAILVFNLKKKEAMEDMQAWVLHFDLLNYGTISKANNYSM